MEFKLSAKIKSFLRNSDFKRNPIMEIQFLGTGGAFDYIEKNSSVVFFLKRGTFLIDCGSTVYSELKKNDIIPVIDYIFITHMHEDHFGSLSTVIKNNFIIYKNNQIYPLFISIVFV